MKSLKFLLSLIAMSALIYTSWLILPFYASWVGLPSEVSLMELDDMVLLAGCSIAIFLCLFGTLVLVAKVLGLQSFNRFVVQSLGWLVVAFVFVCVIGIGAVIVLGVQEDGFIVIPVVLGGLLATVVGGYIGYVILTLLVGFLGHEFEKLGNALPSGRSVLFAEALSAGYNKPQTRAFIMELSRDSGPSMGAGGVYTTLILYVIPALITIALVCDVIYDYL